MLSVIFDEASMETIVLTNALLTVYLQQDKLGFAGYNKVFASFVTGGVELKIKWCSFFTVSSKFSTRNNLNHFIVFSYSITVKLI